MRWESLFADLEAQLEAADRAALDDEVADRTRREVARTTLRDRIAVAEGVRVTFGLGRAGEVGGAVARCGSGWALVDTGHQEVLVAADAVLVATGLPPVAVDPERVGPVAARLGLGYVLRMVSRDRAPVTVVLTDGRRVAGTLDRVGADFVDIAEHPVDEPRRAPNVRAVRTVAFTAIACVRHA